MEQAAHQNLKIEDNNIEPITYSSIHLGIVKEGTSFQFREHQNSSPAALKFEFKSRVLEVRPKFANISWPCLYWLRFQAEGFKFRSDIDTALTWEVPKARPPYAALPVLSEDHSLISMFMVNATFGKQVAEFLLWPEDSSFDVSPIDPTIVHNPDGPGQD